MAQNNRNLLIVSKHRRLTRLWQFFFTGWGLVMVTVLVAASLFTRQILWTPITAINMHDMVSNQFKMTNAGFAGVDKDNNPFQIRAKTGYQEYNNPNVVFLDTLSGKITRSTDKGKVTDKISARKAQFNHKEKVLTLKGNVSVISSDGNKTFTDEMVIRL